jgi:hypothetical protein
MINKNQRDFLFRFLMPAERLMGIMYLISGEIEAILEMISIILIRITEINSRHKNSIRLDKKKT